MPTTINFTIGRKKEIWIAPHNTTPRIQPFPCIIIRLDQECTDKVSVFGSKAGTPSKMWTRGRTGCKSVRELFMNLSEDHRSWSRSFLIFKILIPSWNFLGKIKWPMTSFSEVPASEKKNDDALEMNLNSSSQLFYPITRNYFRHKI